MQLSGRQEGANERAHDSDRLRNWARAVQRSSADVMWWSQSTAHGLGPCSLSYNAVQCAREALQTSARRCICYASSSSTQLSSMFRSAG